MKRKERKNNKRRFRLIDIIVVIFCLSTMAYSLNLFRLDLFKTIHVQNVQPVGVITMKKNTVQRCIANRVLWDRLRVESPVYPGDVIRVANLSATSISIRGQQIDLDENTLIRIQFAPDGSGTLQIELSEGVLAYSSLGVTTDAEAGAFSGGVQLNLMGHIVETFPETMLTAAAGKDGLTVQVNEGNAVFIREGEREGREIPSGTAFAFDSEGTEKLTPAAVVTRPRPNARYVKSEPQPLPLGFMWNRINLRPDDTLRLEIAADRNFNRVARSVESRNDSAEIALDAGFWNWRLSYEGTVLSAGKLTVVEASNLDLVSPSRGSLFRYQDEKPSLHFQWSEIEEASYYVIEIALTQDFANPQISRQIAAPFFADSSLSEGTYYWRARPVFSSEYEGSPAFSPVSFFAIEQAVISENEAVLVLPEPEPPPPPVPVELRLISPAQGARLAGLAALREQTLFTWNADGEVQSFRFVLSRNRNPLAGRPAVEITNPGRTVRLNRLEEGTWYWTVEARSVNGLVSSAAPRQLQVLPVPLLPAPVNLQPADGYLIGIEQLRTQINIDFSWAAVSGANAYIFTLYERTNSGRRQISRTTVTGPAWTLENVRALGRGTFIWQAEAVNRGSGGTIEQRGRTGGNTFTIDIPVPRQVEREDPGALYGF